MKIWLTALALLITNTCLAADLSQLSATPNTRNILYHLAKWPQDCEYGFTNQKNMPQDILKSGGLVIYPLNKTQSVAQVLCFTAAYQSNYYYVFVDIPKGTAQLVSFKLFDFDNDHQIVSNLDTNVAGLPSFKNGLLTLFSKARGAGDCGSLITYGFTGQGKSYVVKARVKECNSNLDSKIQNPEHWPIVESKK